MNQLKHTMFCIRINNVSTALYYMSPSPVYSYGLQATGLNITSVNQINNQNKQSKHLFESVLGIDEAAKYFR